MCLLQPYAGWQPHCAGVSGIAFKAVWSTVQAKCMCVQVRSLRGLSLKSSLEQFSATMTAQTDLRVESAHLRRFFRNFAAVRSAVTPPFPLPGFETASVLVETFEPG